MAFEAFALCCGARIPASRPPSSRRL